jgi:hypothetical protein
MNLELNEFCQPNGNKDSVSYPGADKLCAERDTEDSAVYIFSKEHPYIQHICKFQKSWNNINTINCVQLFIKSPVRYLEHFDSLGLGHANGLKSWVGCTVLNIHVTSSDVIVYA